MRYKENWDTIQTRYLEYWARENHDRPLLAITAPKDCRQHKRPAAKNYATHKERWFDIEHVLEQVNDHFQNTWMGAEALPIYSPNLGPDVFAAFHGVDHRRQVLADNVANVIVGFIHHLDTVGIALDPHDMKPGTRFLHGKRQSDIP